MKRNHKIAFGACSLIAAFGVLVGTNAIHINTVKIPDEGSTTSATHEAKTVTQEEDGHLTIK